MSSPPAKPVAGFFWLCIPLALTMHYPHGWGEEAPVDFLKQGAFF